MGNNSLDLGLENGYNARVMHPCKDRILFLYGLNPSDSTFSYLALFASNFLNSWYLLVIQVINPLKTKRICFIQGLSAYRTVNTLHFDYKNQSLNVL
jgi:hypothetical protein